MTHTTKSPQYIYGFHAVQSLVDTQHADIAQVLLDKDRKDKRIRELIIHLDKKNVRHTFVSRDEIEKLVGEKRHQGVVAKFYGTQKALSADLDTILQKENVFLLVLDGVQDPHNLGACLRSAAAVAIDAVIIPKDRAAGLTPTVRKIASGGAEIVPVIEVANVSETLKKMQSAGVWCVGLAGEANDPLYEADLTGPLAIVMGAEEKGLRRLTRENCDILVKIPMNEAMESLNVSVATGIALFEAGRQRCAAH